MSGIYPWAAKMRVIGTGTHKRIVHTQRSLFFSHAHTRFVLCLRKGIYLWKRAISKTLRSAEWLKGAPAWYKQKNMKNCRFVLDRARKQRKSVSVVYVVDSLVLLKL